MDEDWKRVEWLRDWLEAGIAHIMTGINYLDSNWTPRAVARGVQLLYRLFERCKSKS